MEKTPETEKNGKKRLRISLAIAAIAVAFVLIVLMFFTYGNIANNKFSLGTQINGLDCSGKSVDDTVALLKKKVLSKKVDIKQNGETLFEGDLASLGVDLDEAVMQKDVENLFKNQKANDFKFLQVVETVQFTDIYHVDEDVMKALLEEYLTINTRETKDAYLEFNGTEFEIVPEQYGDEFNVDAFVKTIEKGIAKSISGEVGDLIISVTESDFPKPKVLSTDDNLNLMKEEYNQVSNLQLTYTFGGDTTEQLSQEQLMKFYKQTDEGLKLDNDQLKIYIHDLAEKYNTYKKKRDFVTHYGNKITLNHVTYGYQISETGELEQLKADLETGGEITRDPVYYKTGFQRNGMDDLCGTYVEADLTLQHLWFYKDGNLVIESDFVSGSVAKGKETTPGFFYIAYKVSDYTLKGQDYNTKVSYWMPFNDGQGLHDASWRYGNFGGQIYQNYGSHGCINLPPAVAKTIYENMSAGIPIIVHK